MVKYRIGIRAPIKANPADVAGGIESVVNKALGGRDGCKVTSDPPGIFPDGTINEETGEKRFEVSVNIIRDPIPRGVDVMGAITRGAYPGRVISVKKYKPGV